jgi:hypothetical protein
VIVPWKRGLTPVSLSWKTEVTAVSKLQAGTEQTRCLLLRSGGRGDDSKAIEAMVSLVPLQFHVICRIWVWHLATYTLAHSIKLANVAIHWHWDNDGAALRHAAEETGRAKRRLAHVIAVIQSAG